MQKWTPIVSRLLEGTVAEWVGFIVVAVGIAGAVWCVARFRASLRDDAGHEAANRLLANQIRELHERGEVSEAEFRSLKQKVGPPAAGAEPTPPPNEQRDPREATKE